MKLLIAIFCLFLCSLTMAQRRDDFKSLVLGDYNYAYNKSNCNFYYGQARALAKSNNPDSLRKATKIMWGLCIFDTLKYSPESWEPLLKKIVRSNTKYYRNIIKGTWRFSHDFMDGLGSQVSSSTAQDTNRIVQFNGHDVTFRFNDSVYRKTTYSIEPVQYGLMFNRVNTILICFHDGDEKWRFEIEDKDMTVRIEPYCPCGCYIYFYKKIKDSAPFMVNRK
ncbi:MAG TPA: hypothetical protein VIM79_08590 [Niastella sp.]